MVEIYEVAHLLGKFTPLGSKHHHILTTLVVVILCRDVLLGCLVVDILLCYTEFLLNAKLNWKSVCVPSCFAVNLESLHSLVTVECVFNGARQHVMDARMTISRGRTLEEYELWTTLTLVD